GAVALDPAPLQIRRQIGAALVLDEKELTKRSDQERRTDRALLQHLVHVVRPRLFAFRVLLLVSDPFEGRALLHRERDDLFGVLGKLSGAPVASSQRLPGKPGTRS